MSARSIVPLALAALLAAALPAAEAPAGAPPDEETLRRAVVLHGLALAQMEDGDYGDAAKLLEELARLLPDNLLPWVNLAICRFRTGDLDGALESIRVARRLAPDNPQALFTLARILEARAQAGAEVEAEWEETIDHFAAAHPFDPRPPYLRAMRAEREQRPADAVDSWERALRLSPDNLVLMVGLLRSAAAAGDLGRTSDALHAIQDRLGGFEEPLASVAARLRAAIDSQDAEGLAVPAVVVRNILRPSVLYQLGLDELEGRERPQGPLFPQLDFVPPLPPAVQGGQDIEIRFVQAGARGKRPRTVRLSRARVPGEDRFVVSGPEGVHLLGLEEGRWRDRRLVPAADAIALRLDVDQDGINDLVVGETTDGVRLWHGRSEEALGGSTVVLDPQGAAGLTFLLPVDLDHEGDLDLLVGRAGRKDLFLRNDGDGTWTERAEAMEIGGPEEDSTDAATADFDDDGDLDLLVCHGDAPPRLYLNRRSGPLEDATAAYRLDAAAPAQSVIAADFDNDGLTDLLFWGPAGARLWRNDSGLEFQEEPLAAPLAETGWSCAAAADVDNDGDLDVVACLGGDRPGLVLARNRGGSLAPDPVGLPEGAFGSLLAGDVDDDGDLDLVAAAEDARPIWLRNDGGNNNHWLRLTLRGRNDNNSKNNTQGLFARIEVRAGGAYQSALGDGGVNHLGLGSHRQAEVLRVVWTNGLAQTWRMAAADRTMDEEQVLKGSCPFLYTWDGRRFTFVTDLMWSSPLGMVRDDGTPAPHQSARDFVKVPGEVLRPAGDDLWLQITEELWETIYLDRAYLIAADHPAGTELVVDETFRGARQPGDAPIHLIGDRLAPVAAVDDRGRDVLDRIRARDGRRVDDLVLTRYQGLTEDHSLELTFDGVPAEGRLRLLLWGWIFPTDTSINRALSQNDLLALRPPSLELRERDGWRTLVPFLGFPAGKRKAMVVELSGLLPAGRVTLRIPTNLQIYWDAAALAVGEPAVEPRLTRLDAVDADLHYRGYSRLYRDSPTGPHLFDYSEVSTGVRFRDMEGAFTRFGPVEELLASEDDRYAIMNAGDEVTLRFDARRLPPLAEGQVRDWIVYTDGWVKDADINTVDSATVLPLPYHGMRSYPDRPEHRFPDTPEHREDAKRYQTRHVSGAPFRDALRHPDHEPSPR